MKVLCLIDTLEIGGTEQSMLEILRRFRNTQATMCHVYLGETLKPGYEGAGIPVISLNVTGKYAFPQAIRRVLAVIRTKQPDLIHTNLFRADVIGRTAGRLANIPVLSSFINEPYNPARWASLSRFGQVKLKGVELLDRLTAHWASHFMAVSPPTRDANCRALGISSERVTVIYRGRDPIPFLEVSAEACHKLRGELELKQDGPVILNVARLLQRKGQNELVQAMLQVLQKFPKAQLLIAGEGYDRPHLEATIKELDLDNSVHLLGRRQDIPTLLHLADVFVFPSYYEGHPGSLVEAMLAARPIVASDIPVHREVLANGKSGRLGTVKDPGAMAQGIIWMLENPVEARQMGKQAQQLALARFHIDQIAAQHERLYNEVVQKYA